MPLFDAATTQHLSAPFWFVQFFKTLGFALHTIPVGTILIGLPFALLLWIFGGVNSKRLAQRLFQQIPIFIAFGINFGIVPLLFVQLAYSKAFYTSTILLAWHWIAVLPLLLVAYYCGYLCSSGAKKERIWRSAFFALISAVCFVGVGLVFTSVWTFFERPYEWERVLNDSSHSFSLKNLGELTLGGFGSASGLGIFWKDPTILLRFGGFFGLSFFALATWIVFDAYFVYRGPRPLTREEAARLRESGQEEENVDESGKKIKRRKPRKPIQENPETFPFWASSVACVLLLLGLATTIPTLGKYLLISAQSLKDEEFWNDTLWNALLIGMCASAALPALFLMIAKLRKMSGRTLAVLMTLCEFLLVGCYAVLRQILQNARLHGFYDPSAFADASAVQWTPIFAFLGVFIAAFFLIVILLMRMAATDGRGGKKSDKKRKPRKATEAPAEPKDSGNVKKPKGTPEPTREQPPKSVSTHPTGKNNIRRL